MNRWYIFVMLFSLLVQLDALASPLISQQVDKCGIGVINIGSGSVKVQHELLPEVLRGLIERNEALVKQMAKQVVEQCDIPNTQAAIDSFFKIIQQNPVPIEELDRKFREMARHYKDLMDRAKTLTSEDPEVQKLREDAVKALEVFDFENADKWLNEAQEKDAAAILALEAEGKRIQEATNKRKLSRVDSLITLAKSRDFQLKYADAASYYQKAAELLPVEYETDKGRYLNYAGNGFYLAGKYDEALLSYQEASKIYILGKQHPAYVTSFLNNLAVLYSSQGRYDQALSLLKEALRIDEQVLNKPYPDYATSLNNLANLYLAQSEYEKALPLYQDSLKIRERVSGKQHRDYAGSLNNLAELYQTQGQYEQALHLYQEALAILEQVLGKQYPSYATSLNNLASLYYSQGKYDRALPLYQEALKIREQVLGKQHPDYASSLNNLAALYQDQGEYEKALPLFQQAVEVLTKVLGKKHFNTKIVAENLQRVQNLLNGKFQVIVKQIIPGSSASLFGIQIGDIFTHYDQQPILGTAQFIQGRAKEPADGAAKELTVLRDGKSLTFQLKPGKIGAVLEEKLKSEP